MRAKDRKETEMDFDEWWTRRGQYVDPEASVSWADKRKGLAEEAFAAAKAQSGNYVADAPEGAHRVTFANGREVYLGKDGELKVGWANRLASTRTRRGGRIT